MEALSKAILRLLRRQEQSDRRLDRIEEALALSPRPVQETQAATAPSRVPRNRKSAAPLTHGAPRSSFRAHA